VDTRRALLCPGSFAGWNVAAASGRSTLARILVVPATDQRGARDRRTDQGPDDDPGQEPLRAIRVAAEELREIAELAKRTGRCGA
jgi:hypothetical protein